MYTELFLENRESLKTIEQILNACKTEALKLKHHMFVTITRSVAQQNWTFLTDTPIVVKHGYAYLEAGRFSHITFKETIKKFKIKIFN